MEFLAPYHKSLADGRLAISAQQASLFAKQVADDFNPIHDPESARFCVPGDLLFALALSRYGMHQTMRFRFQDLVAGGAVLSYPQVDPRNRDIEVFDDRERAVLGMEFAGDTLRDEGRIEQLIRQYVAFSGHNFPPILVPLMQQHQVMINTRRPLVIYATMSLEFETLNYADLQIHLGETELSVNGRRGNAQLHFSLMDGSRQIGGGVKTLVLSGLKQYEQSAIDAMVDEYNAKKARDLAAMSAD